MINEYIGYTAVVECGQINIFHKPWRVRMVDADGKGLIWAEFDTEQEARDMASEVAEANSTVHEYDHAGRSFFSVPHSEAKLFEYTYTVWQTYEVVGKGAVYFCDSLVPQYLKETDAKLRLDRDIAHYIECESTNGRMIAA